MISNPQALATLSSLAAIQVTGPDARIFLQGQLSNDLERLTPQQCLLAACNSPQGRVQAVLRIFERDDGWVLVLPTELLGPTLTRLRKYVLRAKVTLTDLRPQVGLFAASRDVLLARGWPEPSNGSAHAQHGELSVLHWRQGEDRYLMLQPVSNGASAASESADAAWQLADIRAGLPQVFAATHELFVAQMLNLDLLDGIAFDKGCYTGQEIIARAHFRGAIKRRMFRFRAKALPPASGTRILAAGAPAGDVVMSAATNGGSELLAVIQLPQLEARLELEQSNAELERLELPYFVPSSHEAP